VHSCVPKQDQLYFQQMTNVYINYSQSNNWCLLNPCKKFLQLSLPLATFLYLDILPIFHV